MPEPDSEPSGNGLTTPERVIRHLQLNRPRAYCDDCLAAALSLNRAQVSIITSTLGLCKEYSRGTKTCADCGRAQKFATHTIDI